MACSKTCDHSGRGEGILVQPGGPGPWFQIGCLQKKLAAQKRAKWTTLLEKWVISWCPVLLLSPCLWFGMSQRPTQHLASKLQVRRCIIVRLKIIVFGSSAEMLVTHCAIDVRHFLLTKLIIHICEPHKGVFDCLSSLILDFLHLSSHTRFASLICDTVHTVTEWKKSATFDVWVDAGQILFKQTSNLQKSCWLAWIFWF